MATLVTGGTGFIGSNIVKELAQRGHDVVCFDLVAADALVRQYLEPWGERVTYVQGDIVKKTDLEQAAERHNITKIVHAAVFTGVTRDVETPQTRSIVDINVVGTTNLLELARTLPLERFLYVSTIGVYGGLYSPDGMLPEDSSFHPRNLYDDTKCISELLTRRYGELHGFEAVRVREGPTYGPMERVTGHRAHLSVFHEWTGNVVRGESLRVGDRTFGRQYSYVDDIAAGICTVLDAPSLSYDVYNVATGSWITLGEVIETLQELRPSLQVVDDPAKVDGIWEPVGARGLMDVTRLREDLGFTNRSDITAALRDYLQWRETASFLD